MVIAVAGRIGTVGSRLVELLLQRGEWVPSNDAVASTE